MSGLLIAGFFDQGFFRGLLMIAIAFCWGVALYDLATRNMRGIWKAVWLIVILVLPILGTVIYLLVQPFSVVGPSPTMDAIGRDDVRASQLTPPGI